MGGLSPSVRAHVSASGRLYIPSRLRGLVGLERGGSVVVRVENGELRVRTVQDVMAELQAESLALFAGSGESVDAFLADRHVKAATENET